MNAKRGIDTVCGHWCKRPLSPFSSPSLDSYHHQSILKYKSKQKQSTLKIDMEKFYEFQKKLISDRQNRI